MDEPGITARVRAMRLQRGLTQRQLAEALGKGLQWVKKFEAGGLQSDPRISLLIDIARVLGVPLSVLLDDAPATAPTATVDTIRAALLVPAPTTAPARLNVTRQTAYGYNAFQAGHLHDLGALLPALLDAARAATGSGAEASVRDLADVFHLTAITLIKLGDGPAAWCAADKALAAAELTGDPVEIALAAQSTVYAATSANRPDAALATAHDVLDRTASPLTRLGDNGWTALGMLYLKAAVAAAGQRDTDGARGLLESGRLAAGHVRPDANVRRTGFNQTNVLLYEASILGDLGDYDAALAAAACIDPAAFAVLPRERRIHHLIDTARSAHAAGQPDGALALLMQAERDDPRSIRSLPGSHAVIMSLLTGQRRPADERGLRALAARAGVAE